MLETQKQEEIRVDNVLLLGQVFRGWECCPPWLMGSVPSCDPAGMWPQEGGTSQGRGREGSVGHAGAAVGGSECALRGGRGECYPRAKATRVRGGDSLSHFEKTEVPPPPEGAPSAGPAALRVGGGQRGPRPVSGGRTLLDLMLTVTFCRRAVFPSPTSPESSS